MPSGERNAGVVADAADDQMIADEDGVFHRAARNHARLHERAFDEEEREDHPEPGNDFAPDLIAGRSGGVLYFFAAFRVGGHGFRRRQLSR